MIGPVHGKWRTRLSGPTLYIILSMLIMQGCSLFKRGAWQPLPVQKEAPR